MKYSMYKYRNQPERNQYKDMFTVRIVKNFSDQSWTGE